MRDYHYNENRIMTLMKNLACIRESFEKDIPINLFTLVIAIGYDNLDIKSLKERLQTFKESMGLSKNRIEIKTFDINEIKN